MYTNVDFIPGGDNPVKGGFGYPLKQGARSEKLEARRGRDEGSNYTFRNVLL